MRNIKIISVVGARPNFVKIAPFLRETQKRGNITNVLVHTGQHYTDYMSDIFFKDFRISRYVGLNVGPSGQIEQMAKIMTGLERVFLKERPDLVVVVGDVTSTLAAALVATRLGIKVAHIEAGLRSFDRTMPEEINRLLTDAISDYLFVTEPSGVRNLKKEGVPDKKIFFVGNIMIDSLVAGMKEAKKRAVARRLGLRNKDYAVLTLHRPSNVDTKEKLGNAVRALSKLQKIIKVVYPVHPRTLKMLKRFGYLEKLKEQPGLILVRPLGYMDFLSLMIDSRCVITDSGGMQEETTYLGIPCFTLRKNTERPVTVTQGTNIMIGEDYNRLLRLVKKMPFKRKSRRPGLWDGKTAGRIVDILERAIARPGR